MKLKEALKRIDELERRVLELETRKPVESHFHYHYPQYIPTPQYVPSFPQPYWTTTWARGASADAVMQNAVPT